MAVNAVFDLSNAAVRADPYPVYDRMRREHPVFHRPDRGDWFVFRYADVFALLKDPRLGHPKGTGDWSTPAPDVLTALHRDRIEIISLWMANQDAHRHAALRNLVQPLFTSERVADWKGRIDSLVQRGLARQTADGRLDVIGDLARPMTVAVAAALVGLPEDGQVELARLTHDAHYALDTEQPVIQRARGGMAMSALIGMIRRLLAGPTPPGDTLAGALLRAEALGYLTRQETVAQCLLILIAGEVNVQHVLGNGLLALLRQPDQLARLRAEPALLDSAIAELLRYDPPFHWILRFALADLTVGGQQIPQGALVRLMIGSANRDPQAFSRPDSLDITRAPNPHLAFGYGSHYCIGAGLARLQIRITLDALLTRMPRMALDKEPVRDDLFVPRGLTSLLVRRQ